MIRLLVREPVASGLNVTVIVQLALGPTLVPQVLVCEKSALLPPPVEMLLIPSDVVAVLVSVTFCGVPEVPT